MNQFVNYAGPGTYVVHRCLKGDHQPELMGLPACGLEPVASQAGVVASIAVNPGGQGDGGSRGYLGIELTKAPINPGAVFILVESLGPIRYRIRQQAHFFEGRGGEEEHRGAFALASVMGGEILDENFQRVDPLAVHDWPTGAYVRSLEPSGSAAEVSAQVVYSENGVDIREATARLARLGPATSGPAVYLGPLSLVPSSGSCPLPVGSARALDIPFDSLAVTYGRITAYVARAIRALVGVDALPKVTLAINTTADSSDDIVAVEPPDPTDVRVTLSGGCFDVSFVTEPPGMAAVLPSMAKLGDGEAATVQLFAVDTSQEPQDVMLRAYVLGYKVAERPFTNIKAEIVSTDITVEPERAGIGLRLHPEGMLGLRLKLELIRPDATTFTLVDNELRTGCLDGEACSASFRLRDLPARTEGEFASVRARWGMAEKLAEANEEYHFKNLGLFELSQYNVPSEADPTCQGSPIPACFVDDPCSFVEDRSLPGPFEREVIENGSGISVSYGVVAKESFCTEEKYNPPQRWFDGQHWRIIRSHATISPTCAGKGYSRLDDTTVARNQYDPDLMCGTEIYIEGVGRKSVTDSCQACEGRDQLDNFNAAYHRCSGLPHLTPDKRVVVKLWQ